MGKDFQNKLGAITAEEKKSAVHNFYEIVDFLYQ